MTLSYLAALIDGGGTVPPELGAVRRLVARGHRVSVLAEQSMADEVLATGAELHLWATAPNRADRRPEHDPLRDWEVKRPPEMVARLVDRLLIGPAGRYAADVQAAIDADRPDAVLCSQFAFGAMLAAEAAALPFAVLMPNVYLLPAPGMPPFGLGLQPARGRLGRLRDQALGNFSQRLWDRKGLGALNALRAELGLAPLSSFWEQIHRADRELLLTSADFDFPAELPSQARYVGPVLDDPAWAEAWEPVADDRPLVLVAFSSTFQNQGAALQRVTDALATLPVRGLVTTGPALAPEAISAPPNVVVRRSAPHAQILKRAAALVTHGGHGTVVKALVAGVPMVIVPHGRDQADNAARVAARGAGERVKPSAGVRVIGEAMGRVLAEPSYRQQAATLGATLRRDADSERLEQELELLAGADQADAVSSH